MFEPTGTVELSVAMSRRTLTVAAAVLAALLLQASAAVAGVANAGLPGASATNPLAGMPWGNYSGPLDEVFPAFETASGPVRQLLGLVALRPRMRWFGAWYSDPRRVARQYIANVTAGNPNALAQMAVFRLVPWEGEACQRLPTPAEQAQYKSWIDGFAAGIGSGRVAMVLQPDLPFARCVPHHSSLPLRLVAYAARRFSALPHTTVYIDAGASDWPSVREAAALLRGAGVRYTRGFALNATHYASTQDQIRFGGRVVHALGAAGIPGRHFVINTAENGRPFTYQQYHGPDFDNAAVCPTPSSQRCVTLGLPPTTSVSDPQLRLSRGLRAVAAGSVDAYLWIGRPWLVNQAEPFDPARTLELARSTPF
jgi:endoglucanase